MMMLGGHLAILVFLVWLCIATRLCLTATGQLSDDQGNNEVQTCVDNSECSGDKPVCCGEKGSARCRTRDDCVGVPCSSSFECDDGKMWCCAKKCQASACLLPIWAIVLIVMAVAIIVSVLLIYIILECCRRWPGVQQNICWTTIFVNLWSL